MKVRKIISLAVAAAAAVSSFSFTAFSEGDAAPAETVSIEEMLEEIPAESIIVTETGTGKVLFEKNSGEVRTMSHMAKLMTLLIAAEKIDCGEIGLSDTVTVSANANSKQGTQIWLDKGEKISVEELIKSITVGNANDACTALAEHIAGSEEEFVALMNSRAAELSMDLTKFADCTGMSEETVSSAEDISKLCAQLLKHDFLRTYLTTWIDEVRDGKAELVNLNRLVRTYSGISGMKACASEKAGECSAVTAERNGLSVCVVILGCNTSENRDAAAKKLLDMSFECFQIYEPEIPDELLQDIPVKNGVKQNLQVKLADFCPVVIPRGSYASVETEFEKTEQLDAPVEKGAVLGKLVCTLGDEELLSIDIYAAESIDKMNIKCGFLKLMYNLFSFN